MEEVVGSKLDNTIEMLTSHGVSTVELQRSSPVFGVDNDVINKYMVEMENSENNVVDARLVRLCHGVFASEVKALKADINILKRSLEEEKDARKAGDSLSGDAILQLQIALELDLTQHLTSESKLRQHFEVEMSRETSNFQQVLENRLSHHDLISKDLLAFRRELDREFKSRFEQFDRRFQEEHR